MVMPQAWSEAPGQAATAATESSLTGSVTATRPTGAAGMHMGTLSFTAATPGTYYYLCPVPGHAQKGMTGQFTVTP